jgi:hypothetical protein
VPFSNVDKKDRWKVMVCGNIGLTLEDMATNKNGKVSGLGSVIFGNKAGVAGIGFRPLPFLKFDCNGLFYFIKNPNPLSSHNHFVCSPFFGASLNLNIIKLFAGQPNSLTTLQNQLK